MNLEDELRTLLTDRAERVQVDPSRRDDALRRATRGRGLVAVVALAAAASLVVVGISVGGSFRHESPRPAPLEQPTEQREPEDEDLIADVRIAEAADGAWTLYAGANSDGETICFRLEGGACTASRVRDGFILLQSFDDIAQDGFIYGPVDAAVASLELVSPDRGAPLRLRLRRFPQTLGLDHLRFFVRPIHGPGKGTLVARSADGAVLQETDVTWGGWRSGPIRGVRSVDVRSMVARFMARRIAGAGAEQFLDADGRAKFGPGGQLGPLYPDPPLEDFEIVFVEDLAGDGTYEVGVRLIYEAGSYGETFFVHPVDGELVISGGRNGLEGP